MEGSKNLTEALTVKQIRAMMQLNQKDFGSLIGLTASALMRRENGKTPWKMHEISAIAKVSGISVDRIRA